MDNKSRPSRPMGRLHKNESSKVSRRVLRGETQLMIDLRASVGFLIKQQEAEKEIRETRARCYLTPRPVINFNSFASIFKSTSPTSLSCGQN